MDKAISTQNFMLRHLALLLFGLLAILCLYSGFSNPVSSWDTLGYVASAKSFEENDVQKLHEFAYREVAERLPKTQYEQLISGSAYRQAVASDPLAFGEQLPFYQIRVFYTGLVYLFYKSQVNIVFATHLISSLAILGVIALLYLLSVQNLSGLRLFAVPFMAWFFHITDLARYSTPDGLAFLAMTALTYSLLTRRINLLCILFPLVICVRTDLIALVAPMAILMMMSRQYPTAKLVFSLVASLVVWQVLEAIWGNAGWATVFYFAMIERVNYPLSSPPTLTIELYFDGLLAGIKGIATRKTNLVFLVIAAIILFRFGKRALESSVLTAIRSEHFILMLSFIIYLGVHFLAFPVSFYRFVAGAEILCTFCLLILFERSLTEKRVRI